MKNLIAPLFVILALISCETKPFLVEGLYPVYFDANDFSGIASSPPRIVMNQGKIIKIGDFLFINEIKKGIHVIDNSDPTNPEYVYFWNIPGNLNFTINGNYLYADNGPHLLVINISDFSNIKFEKFIEDIFFENLLEQFPDQPFTWFECADPEKGLVKEWLTKILENPLCQTQDL